jgi:putative membrane protein
MIINNVAKHALKLANGQCSKFIVSSVAKLSLAMMAVEILFALSSVKAETAVSMSDTNFIQAAAQGGMTEVKLGELAAANGIRDDVKHFGQMMVKDHKAVNNDLKALAAQKGVSLPERMDAKHQAMVDKLTGLTGSAFDDAYVVAMIKGHIKDDKAFKAESNVTQDADIRVFLDKSIPVVESHLQQIMALKK